MFHCKLGRTVSPKLVHVNTVKRFVRSNAVESLVRFDLSETHFFLVALEYTVAIDICIVLVADLCDFAVCISFIVSITTYIFTAALINIVATILLVDVAFRPVIFVVFVDIVQFVIVAHISINKIKIDNDNNDNNKKQKEVNTVPDFLVKVFVVPVIAVVVTINAFYVVLAFGFVIVDVLFNVLASVFSALSSVRLDLVMM